MRVRFSLLIAALMVWVIAQSLPTLHSPAPRTASLPETIDALPPTASERTDAGAAFAAMSLRFDDLVYQVGDSVTATLDLGRRDLAPAGTPAVLISSPDSGDVEILRLASSSREGIYQGATPVPTSILSDGEPVRPYDGILTVMPGEMFHAIWLVDGLARTDATEPPILSDFAVVADASAIESLPFDVIPELAHWDGGADAPPMEKPFGTLLSPSGVPLQVALNELVVAPRSPDELDQVLALTGGRVVLNDTLPREQEHRDPRYYLIEVDTGEVDLSELPTLRRLLGQTGFVAADSEQVLRTLALTMKLRLDGYPVGVNPRLRYAAPPKLSVEEETHLPYTMRSFGPMNVPELWAFMAMWDFDQRRVPAAFLDMGFAPNHDFREPLVQCDMEAGTLAEGLACGPGIAVGPPTVGNSFFGSFSWHGNGVVTAAGGVVNNGWGTAGVGGQVVEPMLYRYGLASYAFEMGLGIRKATLDGASVINLSASYPCTVVTEFDIGISYCEPGERIFLCTLISGGLGAAVETICGTIPYLVQVPVIGSALAAAALEVCNAGRAVVAVAATACYGTLLLGDLKGNLEEAVAFATEQGVPIVNSAGNKLSRSSLPEILRDLIDVDNAVADDWDQIPGVIPQVISAGATRNFWPYDNRHFHGPSVDIWAPITSTYFAPRTTDTVTDSDDHVSYNFGGTSAAAPYVAGLIACMQAVNPELNPGTPGLTATQRATIVPRITSHLLDNAWTTPELVAISPGSIGPQVEAAGAERRNLVNPLRTIQAVAGEVIPDFGAMGYDTLLNADEITQDVSADTEPFAHPIALGETFTGSVLTIRGEGGAPDLQDVDWFRFSVPDGPEQAYTARFRLSVPSGFGALTTDTPGYSIEPSAMSTPGEDVYHILSPALVAGGESAFRIAPVLDSDNVYKLQYFEAEPLQIIFPPLPLPRSAAKPTRTFQWSASGDFHAVIFLPQGEPLTATVRTADGAIVKTVTFPTSPAALQTASLEIPNLGPGEYRIELSQPVRILFPDDIATAGPRAVPPRLQLHRTATGSRAAWPFGALRYQLETTDDPASGNWTPVSAPNAQHGRQYHCELPLSGETTFYRLRETNQHPTTLTP